jgi:N-glycosylase/DNA lyase
MYNVDEIEGCTRINDGLFILCLHALGVRVLRIDPIENLFSFICTSNNNIPRITQMIDSLCIEYGSKLTTVNGHIIYSFPNPENLVGSGK